MDRQVDDAVPVSIEQLAFSAVFENTALSMALFDPQGVVLRVNPALADRLGYAATAMAGQPFQQFIQPVDFEQVQSVFQALQQGLWRRGQLITQCRHRDGRFVELDVELIAAATEQNESICLVMIESGTARYEKAETALRAAEYRVAVYNRLSPMGIIEFDNDFNITAWNPGAQQIFGYAEEEALGRDTFDILVPDYEREAVRQIHLWEHPQASENINDNKTKDGRIIACQWFNTPQLDIDGNVTGLTAVCQDITDQIRMEEALRDSEEKYRNVVRNAIEAICVIQDGNFRYFNPEALRLYGYSADELSALPANETIHPDDLELVLERRRLRLEGEKVASTHTHRIVTKENRIRWADIKAVTITWNRQPATLVFLTDVTERKHSEDLMIQTEKMMSVGGLAAGMAHELNNPIGGMLLATQNIIRRLSPDIEANRDVAARYGIDLDRLQAYLADRQVTGFLEGIQASGRKASQIINSMLQFSRKRDGGLAPVRLDSLLENVLELAGKEYDLNKRYDFRNIRIVKDFDPSLPPVPCHETEIEQVVLNLLKNAAQAMRGDDRPREDCIILRLRREEAMALIEVEDSGPGMTEAVRKRVFEPFFTTKPVGEGTGLGLSVSYTIITHNHRGTIETESAPGKGARFIIRLPLTAPS